MAAKDWRTPSNEPDAAPGRPAKADWRRPASHSTPPPVAGKKAGRSWLDRPDQKHQDARRWYWIRVASWAILAVTLFVVLIVVILYWPQRTPLVAMAVTDYGSLTSRAVPPNGWAKEDVESLGELDAQQIVNYAAAVFVPGKTGESVFDGLREEIRTRPKWWNLRRYPIIVYLSVHGVVNQDGKPCLLLPGDNPLASDKWLPLEKLVEYLFPADAQAALPAKKLLILDCNRMDVNYRLGLLYNSFADGLADVVKKTPGLAILNSTGPGQIGWTSPEQLHSSVFAYFVRQGLRGTADRRDEGGDGNGKLTLRELHAYVAQRVRQWVLERRADIQEPMLFTEEEDFFLAHAPKNAPPTGVPEGKFDSKTRWTGDIDALWSDHQRLRMSSPWRINPLGWEEFQQGLLLLEQLAVAGPSYDKEYIRLKDDLNAKVQSLGNQGLPKDLSVSSIPLRLKLAPDADLKKVEDERKTLRAQWNPAEQRFSADAVGTASYLAAAAEAWRQCMLGLDSARWPDVLQFVDAQGRQGRSAGDVVEMHFLRMLNAHTDPVTLKDYRVAVERALAARDLAEKAAAPDDERVHYWAQPAVDKADEKRRRAEDQLFLGSPEAAREAEQALDALVSSDRQAGAYPEAVRGAEKVAKAFALRDRAWAEIPYYARWLLARQRAPDERQMQLLVSLIQNTHALGAELDRAILKRDWTPMWEPSYQAAEAARSGLEKDFQQECTWLWERAPLNRETQQAISVVLSVPLVSGKDRSILWANYWDIAEGKRSGGESQTPAGKPDEKGKAAEGAKTEPKGVVFRVGGVADQDATAAYLTRLPVSHPVLAVLGRSRLGIGDPDCLTRASNAAAARGADEIVSRLARLAQQGQCVREVVALGGDSVEKQCKKWTDESTSRLDAGDRSPGENREGRAKADRLLRAAAPLMDLARSPWSKPEDDPPHQLRRLDLHYLLVWHAYRTLDDFWGPWPPRGDAPADKVSPSFFATAADQYLTAAAALAPSVKRFRYDSPELKEAVDLRARLEARRKVAGKVVEAKVPDLSIKKADPAGSKTQEATTPGEIGTEIADNLPEGAASLYLRDPAAGDRLEQTIPMLIRGDQGRTEFRRISAAVKSGQRSLPQKLFSLRSEDPRLQHNPLYAVGLYRGHEFWSPFTASEPTYVLTYVPPRYDPPTVTVMGEAVEEPCPVVFILDCSGSMTQDILDPWEPRAGQAAAAASELKRFAIARHALIQILDRLARSEIPYEVGLIAYGHRVGWDRDSVALKDIMVIWDPKDPGNTTPRPATYSILPSEDVEVLHSPTRFGPTELASLSKDLDALRPLGETPLYMAIQKAVGELQRKRPAGDASRPARRHILVITDGMNEVFGTEGKRVYKSDLSELFQSPENRDITLDVIGFNLSDWDLLWQYVRRRDDAEALKNKLKPRKDKGDSALAAAVSVDSALAGKLKEFQDLRQELEQLLDETKHKPGSKGFYRVAGATGVTQVIEALQESLDVRRAKYTVERASDARVVASAELKETVELKEHVGVQRYQVKVGAGDRPVSTEVTLEGGEAEMIFLSKDGARLEHQRYGLNLRASRDNVPDPADPENRLKRFFVGAHIPDWKDADVKFWISIQNSDATKFSPRPKEAWIQVRPLVPEGSPPPAPYIVYDMTFESQLPVPVLTFTAPNWPKAADEAEIQLWFKFEKTRADPPAGIAVDELRKRGGFQLPDVPAATFSVDLRQGEQGAKLEVLVSERYAPGKPMQGVRVEMDPPPEKIARQYNEKAGSVLHTFYYDAGVAPQAGAFRVLLTPHNRLAERAVTLPAPPLKIGIARRSR